MTTDTRRTARRSTPAQPDRERVLRDAAADYAASTRALRDARQRLKQAMRDADQDGWRQVDILKATDHVWTREMVRRVCAGEAAAADDEVA